jgi:TRAP-type transport system small permease protein
MADESKEQDRPFRLEEAVGAAAMGLIALISISNVVVRYATDVSFAFTEEYSVFLLVVVTFVGCALAYANNDHIRIAYLADRSGRIGRFLSQIISLSASTAMFSLLIYYGGQLAFDEYIYEETSAGLGYPSWIYTIWLPLLSLVVLLRILQQVRRAIKGAP